MEFKGTKENWYLKENTDNVVFCESGVICLVGSVRKIDESRLDGESWISMRERTDQLRVKLMEERLANSKLIAAAPELLEALKAMVSYFGYMEEDSKQVIEAKKAIEKALK